ncbi:damage-inducible protein DinB [Sphingobacterium alkalisoli]|uniref:Damage-inducible protein DinB n=1 Tax=Sphingobacterium alkalisoli TaxID=1874115 RepID=A0A4V6WF37_9SPHI|nr:DinB family protein [Sphingobacterium alkalisoli]TJY63759.1 damage-inducible protein DinB [Sphingobacterium alkalisoli]GGH25073.1 DNA damage-inducible protein DinB [Sphingobacterium alkalisoli]
MNTAIISKEELLSHWQGHRTLTRKTIEKFPEQELFSFSVGGMRTFADLVKELLSIAGPGLEGIVNNSTNGYNHNLPLNTKEELLAKWDAETPKINELYGQISDERFHEKFNLFGEYEFPIIHNILYFIDNEIHHRAQGYVYLRALNIEPPFFWDR